MRKSLIGLMLVIGACSGDSTGPTNTGPASLTIGATSTILTVGTTTQLTATVLDSKSNVLAGVTVTWQSDNASIASVTSAGLVTAVAEGSTSIRATAGSVSSTVSITVNRDYCTNALSLAVGEVKVLSGPSAVSCLTLAATSGATDFLFVTANATPVPDNLGFYNVSLATQAGVSSIGRGDRSQRSTTCSSARPSIQ